MELFSYDKKDDYETTVATLDDLEVFRSDSGKCYLRKPSGAVYSLNPQEAADPEAFLKEVKKYNL